MAHRTGLLLALLLFARTASAAVAPTLPSLSPDVRVQIVADRLVSDVEGRAEAEGDVRLSAGPIRVAAERATYDPDATRLEADGNVTMVSGMVMIRAKRVAIDLDSREGVLEGAALFEKSEPLGIEEAADATLDELRERGRNTLQVEAGRLVIEPEGALVAYDPTVTTCDCDDDPPSWTLGASRAVIIPGASLRLHWPVLKARGVPVLAFPYLSLPLEPRKTGLLPPRVSPAGRLGFSWEQELFLVLGESYDATIGADFFAGDERDGKSSSFAGPRARLEFRYAPRVGSSGRAFAAYAHDRSAGTSPARAAIRTHRWNVALDQTDDWGDGFSDRIDLALFSDRAYLSDFTDSITLRGEQTIRSSAWFAHRSDKTLLSFDAGWLQDLRPTLDNTPEQPAGESLQLFGSEARRPFQRLPAFGFELLQLAAGPVRFDLGLGLVRYDPSVGVSFDDVGADGLGPGDFGYAGPDTGEGDGRFGAGETSATTRLSLRPAISVPLTWDRFLSVVPYAAYRLQLYQNDVGENGDRSWGLVGATARTELARTFGKDGKIRHAIGPRVELRRLLPVTAHPTARIFDQDDVGPARTETQGRVSLWQRLSGRSKLGPAALELELGEELLVAPDGKRWEDFVDLEARLGKTHASLRLCLDPSTGSSRELALDAGFDSRYVALGLEYQRVAPGASARLLAGPDELFGTRERFPELGEVSLVKPSITLRPLRGLELSYRTEYLQPLDEWIQQVLGVSYTSSCNCWSMGFQLAYRYPYPRYPDYPNFQGFTFSLGGLVGL